RGSAWARSGSGRHLLPRGRRARAGSRTSRGARDRRCRRRHGAPPRRETRRGRASRRAPRNVPPRRAARAPSRTSPTLRRTRRTPTGTRVSRLEPRAIGIEERAEVDAHRHRLPVDDDVERSSLDRKSDRHDRETDHLAQLVAAADARDSPGGLPADDDLTALERDLARRALEAGKHPPEPTFGHLLGRPLAGEGVLVSLEGPGHRGFEQVRLRVGVLADDHVTLLEAEDALRLEPEGTRTEVGAALQDLVPHVLGMRAREVQLVAELADEADAQRERQ